VHSLSPAVISPFALFEDALAHAQVFGLCLSAPPVEQFLRLPSGTLSLLHVLAMNPFGMFPGFPRETRCGFSTGLR
jgi:hypothetical protein